MFSGDSLVSLFFGCSLFLMAYLSGMTSCRYYGMPSRWCGYLPLTLSPFYAALGKLVTGSSRTRFSLLCSARISRGGILLVWWMTSIFVVMGFWYQKFESLTSLSAHVLVPATTLSTILFLWEGFASRTVACALCLLEGPEKSAGGEIKPKKRQYDNPYCFHDSRNRPAPCRPGQFFWPRLPFKEVRNGKQEPRAVEVVAEDVFKKYEEASNSKESQVNLDFQDGYLSCKEGSQRKGGGNAETAQRNEDLPERRWLEGPRSCRVPAKPAGHRSDAEDRFSPTQKIGTADSYQPGLVMEGSKHQEMPDFVENGVNPYKEEKFCDYTDNGKERIVFGKGNNFVKKISNSLLEFANHFSLLLLCVFYLFVLPLNTILLLSTAVRSRFDRWIGLGERVSSPGWVIVLSILAWMLAWFMELLVFGYTGGLVMFALLEKYYSVL